MIGNLKSLFCSSFEILEKIASQILISMTLRLSTSKGVNKIPCGLTARIAGFHPAGPGSTPGMGSRILFFIVLRR